MLEPVAYFFPPLLSGTSAVWDLWYLEAVTTNPCLLPRRHISIKLISRGA